jgi:hypothetical protein
VARPCHATARVIAHTEASCHSIEVGTVSIGHLSTDTAYVAPLRRSHYGSCEFRSHRPIQRLNSIYHNRDTIDR